MSDSHNQSSASQHTTHQQETLDLSIALLERPSVTPDDDGCQDMLSARLEQAGFDCEFMYFENKAANMPKSKTCGHAAVLPIQ